MKCAELIARIGKPHGLHEPQIEEEGGEIAIYIDIYLTQTKERMPPPPVILGLIS